MGAAIAPEDLVNEVGVAAFDPYTGDNTFFALVAENSSNVRPPTVAERLVDFRAMVRHELMDTRTSTRAKAERFRVIVEETVRASFRDVDAADVLEVRQKWRDQLLRCRRENRHLIAENRRLRAQLRAAGPAAEVITIVDDDDDDEESTTTVGTSTEPEPEPDHHVQNLRERLEAEEQLARAGHNILLEPPPDHANVIERAVLEGHCSCSY